MNDEKTTAYFDKEVPEYDIGRFNYTLGIINKYASEEHTLLEIGCGTGNILGIIQKNTPINKVAGLDSSRECLKKCSQRVNGEVFCGSIIDSDFIGSIKSKYDFVIIGAVLHHICGKTRKESRDYAVIAVNNALKLLNDSGYLIIIEPAFYPSLIMDILFYVKRFFSAISNERLDLGKWNNIGAPLVSYYTNEQLLSFAPPYISLIASDIRELGVSKVMRMFLIKRRTDTTLVFQKKAA